MMMNIYEKKGDFEDFICPDCGNETYSQVMIKNDTLGPAYYEYGLFCYCNNCTCSFKDPEAYMAHANSTVFMSSKENATSFVCPFCGPSEHQEVYVNIRQEGMASTPVKQYICLSCGVPSFKSHPDDDIRPKEPDYDRFNPLK